MSLEKQSDRQIERKSNMFLKKRSQINLWPHYFLFMSVIGLNGTRQVFDKYLQKYINRDLDHFSKTKSVASQDAHGP